mmetsp:Transcript_3322/g.4098  ORF Transcript_3322/g.4098 Transcript_3322/m.4098 type:complete len:130 (-) Transcript_3322:557-946(-)
MLRVVSPKQILPLKLVRMGDGKDPLPNIHPAHAVKRALPKVIHDRNNSTRITPNDIIKRIHAKQRVILKTVKMNPAAVDKIISQMNSEMKKRLIRGTNRPKKGRRVFSPEPTTNYRGFALPHKFKRNRK